MCTHVCVYTAFVAAPFYEKHVVVFLRTSPSSETSFKKYRVWEKHNAAGRGGRGSASLKVRSKPPCLRGKLA